MACWVFLLIFAAYQAFFDAKEEGGKVLCKEQELTYNGREDCIINYNERARDKRKKDCYWIRFKTISHYEIIETKRYVWGGCPHFPAYSEFGECPVEEKIETPKQFFYIEALTDELPFIRISQSAIVNLNFVAGPPVIDHEDQTGSYGYFILTDNKHTKLGISRSKFKSVQQFYRLVQRVKHEEYIDYSTLRRIANSL